MLLRVYSFCVFIIDLLNFLLFLILSSALCLVHIIFPCRKKSVKSENVLIIGASSSIGHALALNLSKLGATVICIDINSVDNEATVKDICIAGGKAYGYTCDIGCQDQVIKTIATIKRDLEITSITMLFHCCGVPSIKKYIEPPSAVKTVMDINILSNFWFLDEIFHDMKANKHGHIVFLSSKSGISEMQYQMPLTVAQYAVQGVCECLLDDLAKDNLNKDVTVTHVHIYPFVVKKNEAHFKLWSKIPNWFGRIEAEDAAVLILNGVLRNQIEISIPRYALWFGYAIRLIPRCITLVFKDFVDTGIVFGLPDD